jgi:nucleoside-diphosphate-sugar epimerase
VRILVTGSTGFVGSGLLARLLELPDVSLRILHRGEWLQRAEHVDAVRLDDAASPEVAWQPIVHGIDVVIHIAGLAHTNARYSREAQQKFWLINAEGTRALAKAAAHSGVRRFVYLSSIKVNGDVTMIGRPFTISDAPQPRGAYAISKLGAEVALRDASANTEMEYVIIRSPLVYGPGVKANFRNMMRMIWRGVPLPLGGIDNRRSLVARGNLVDFIARCAQADAAANAVLFVSDDRDVSTPQLVQQLGFALHRAARLISVPVKLLKCSAVTLGMRDMASRLCDSLQLDISATKELMRWRPPIDLEDAIQETADEFLQNQDGD